jgi:exopolysaccharide production protein ExoY
MLSVNAVGRENASRQQLDRNITTVRQSANRFKTSLDEIPQLVNVFTRSLCQNYSRIQKVMSVAPHQTSNAIVDVGFGKSKLATRSFAPEKTTWKRPFDLIGSVLLLLFLFPVFVSLIVAQFVSSPGAPIFFRQMRVGKEGVTFSCLKFRTMCTNADLVLRELLDRDPAARAEWARSHKLNKDPRVSRVGRILRATSLDELPQLWNVLRGEMSLVGPRPVTEAEVQKWYKELGGAAAYISVRPGITGLWQVSGRSCTTYEHRVELDCRYVQELSLANDIRILWRTVGAVLRQAGAC